MAHNVKVALVREVCAAMAKVIEQMNIGDKMTMTKFGTISLHRIGGKNGTMKNCVTKKVVPKYPSVRMSFRPSKSLKLKVRERVNNNG